MISLDDFIADHRLPASYRQEAEQWFVPLATRIAEQRQKLGKTLVVGITGTQASGKSTLADLLVFLCGQEYALNAIAISMDDFYLTRQERQALAASVHPLLVTRGVPGTHDIALALEIIDSLADENKQTLVPRFDKSTDDRYPRTEWDCVSGRVDLILLEGWCLGAEPQSDEALDKPVNSFEETQDSNGLWRRYANQQLRDVYPPLFERVDTWIMLKAPSFECVFNWRLEQEEKLIETLSNTNLEASNTMTADELRHFIQHYQRITEHLFKTAPLKADILFELDKDRKIICT